MKYQIETVYHDLIGTTCVDSDRAGSLVNQDLKVSISSNSAEGCRFSVTMGTFYLYCVFNHDETIMSISMHTEKAKLTFGRQNFATKGDSAASMPIKFKTGQIDANRSRLNVFVSKHMRLYIKMGIEDGCFGETMVVEIDAHRTVSTYY